MKQYVPSHSMIDITANGFQHDAGVYVRMEDIPRWIETCDYLPAKGELVLWFRPSVEEWPFMIGRRFGDFVNCFGDYDFKIDPFITHWMPLPPNP